MFLGLLFLCGVAASFCLSWVGLTIVGLTASPFYAFAMVKSGLTTPAALGYTFAGFGLLQFGYVIGGVTSDRIRKAGIGRAVSEPTVRPGTKPLVAGSPQPCPERTGQPRILGSYLPLVTTRRRPCRSDGGPWDGVEEPGYRVHLLVFAWLGRGVSIAIGPPYRVHAAHDQRHATDQPGTDGTMTETSKSNTSSHKDGD